jgi:hypothetical protein
MSNSLLINEQLMDYTKRAEKFSPEKLNTLKKGPIPFRNYEEGNKFRSWFINWNPKLAINLDLDETGSYNNEYIQRAWYYPFKDETVGQYYMRTTKNFSKNTQNTNQNTIKYDAILIGGLDNRAGDLNIDQQVQLLKKGIGTDKNVKGFRFNTSTSEINDFIKNNPKIPVYTFSAGAGKVFELTQNPNVDIQKLFVIEPYGASDTTKQIVNSAISKGMPSKNIYVGDSIYTGKNIAQNVQKSDSTNHWEALTSVGQKTSSLFSKGWGKYILPNIFSS